MPVSEPELQRKRLNLVRAACSECRRRKIKCSGKRPVCASCSRRDLTCLWDVSEGLTRHADLKKRMETFTQRQIELHDRLAHQDEQLSLFTQSVDVLRTGSDQQATLCLARLRLGLAIEDIVLGLEAIQEGNVRHHSRYSSTNNAQSKEHVIDLSAFPLSHRKRNCDTSARRTSRSPPATRLAAHSNPTLNILCVGCADLKQPICPMPDQRED